MSKNSSPKRVAVITPTELEYVEINNLACLRFHYDLPFPYELPVAGDLFTALTLEQAKDTVIFLQTYIHRAEAALSGSSNQKH
ncbi:hypothetical protein HPR01_004063 [Salmonella enterica]|nr:hypothetical protein [Salmonella enterica]EFO9572239.1 hypothetical protein [Salmonella enterica]EHU8502191.1 hypothetical protein [Salmonella enterica]